MSDLPCLVIRGICDYSDTYTACGLFLVARYRSGGCTNIPARGIVLLR
jgi:hypothetical protein